MGLSLADDQLDVRFLNLSRANFFDKEFSS